VLQTVVVAGAGLGGLRAAEKLRAARWSVEIVVVGAERHMPYNRPPLSKEALRDRIALGDHERACEELAAEITFRLRPSLDGVDWRLGQTIIQARLDDRVVLLSDGTTLGFDGLVVATGLRPRRLWPDEPLEGRHVLRTIQDAVALRAELRPGARVVVVGGGFIGCELAATSRQLGCDVAVIEPCPVPMAGPLGHGLGAAVQAHHEQRGVRFHLGRVVSRVNRSTGGVIRSLELDDGTTVGCDVLIEAVGSLPNIEWLEGNGLDLSDGVLCDGWLRIEGRADLVAVGDIARFPNALYDEQPRRVEHWSNPTDTARRAAPALVAHLAGRKLDPQPFAPTPSFWSDQFGLRIQGLGAFALAEEHVLLGGDLERIEEGAVVGAVRGSRLIGLVGVGTGAVVLRPYRPLLGKAAGELMSSRLAA
jgi:3-phenylpropionate/trans-cinnamate dioxygenase ferredoxin reductase component